MTSPLVVASLFLVAGLVLSWLGSGFGLIFLCTALVMAVYAAFSE